MRIKRINESFEEEYNNCFVEFRDGKPSFAYDDYREAVRGISMSRMGDIRMNSDYEEHKYEIKYLKDGIYYDVDDSGKIVKESLKEGTVVGGELLSNLPDGYWNRSYTPRKTKDYSHKWVGREIKDFEHPYYRYVIVDVDDYEYIDCISTDSLNSKDKERWWDNNRLRIYDRGDVWDFTGNIVDVEKIIKFRQGMNESLAEDTIKTKDGKWTNKGKDGTHGKFKTKKEADAQRKAMFANGYRESLTEDADSSAVVWRVDAVEIDDEDFESTGKVLKSTTVSFDELPSFLTKDLTKESVEKMPMSSELAYKIRSIAEEKLGRINVTHSLEITPIKNELESGVKKLSRFLGKKLLPQRESVDRIRARGKSLFEKTSTLDLEKVIESALSRFGFDFEHGYSIDFITRGESGTPYIEAEFPEGIDWEDYSLIKRIFSRSPSHWVSGFDIDVFPGKEHKNGGLLSIIFESKDIEQSLNEKVSPDGYAPEKVGKAYKVFRVRNGKLYPPMVANAGGKDTPVGVWLDAEEGEFAGLSKTGRQQVKSIGSGTLAYRPGWHLGDVPRAPQFDRLNKETGEMEFPKDFVWAECDYAMDVDYQPEADEMGYMRTKVDDEGNVTTYKSDKYQHSLAGLKKLPINGYYKYRTNPRPDTVPWVITGQMKVNRLLSDAEVNEILQSKGIAPIHRQGGDKTLAELGLGGISEAVEKDAEKSNVCPNCGTIMVKDATGMHCPKCDKQPKNDDVVEDFKDPDKMSKKDRKAYYSKQRNTWERNPMTKVKQSGKIYKRDKKVEIEESLLQDIHNDSVSIAKDLGMTSDEMWEKIHEWEKENPHPEFSGAIFYSRTLWNKFLKWLRKDTDNFDRDDFEPSMPNDGFEYDDSDVDSLGKLPF